jgi:peroxiredoxin
MKSLEENYTQFNKFNTTAFGIGVDSAPSNKAWGKSISIIKTKLLSDFWPHGEVAQLYGVFRDKDGFSERANIVIDENRVVVFAKIYPIEQLPDVKEVIGFLKSRTG